MTETQSRTVWPAEASTAQLVSQMSGQVSTLVRDELALARVEMVEKGKRAGKGAGLLGAAGVLAMYGVGALLVTAVAALDLAWPAWLAALVIAVLVFAVAGIAALIGKKQLQQAVPPAPTAAVDSSKLDVDAVKSAVRHGRHG